MSDRARGIRPLRCAIAACVAMATMATGTSAQAPSPEFVRLAARARALDDTLEQLRRAHRALLAVARDTLRDTVRVGPFTIATDARYVDVARAGAESAWARLRPYYGERRIRAATADAVFIVRADSLRRLVYWDRFARMSTHVGTTVEANEVLDRIAPTPVGAVAAYLGDRVRTFVDVTTDNPMRRWALTPPPTAGVAEDAFANSFLQLQTAGSIPARDCSAGILTQCMSALGLVVPPEPIERIFTAAERRAIGRRLFEQRRANQQVARTVPNPCADAAPDTECERFVRSLPPGAIPPPMGTETRVTFVLTALTMGGDGALDRLLADSTVPLSSRLAFAAGVDRDTLLARWRTRVLAARPVPVAPSTAAAVAALVWGIGLSGLALRLARVG